MSGQQRHQATPPWGPSNPQALNRYSYVNNNPLNYVDPSGHYYESGGDAANGYETACGSDIAPETCDGTNEVVVNGETMVAVWVTETDGSRRIKYFAQKSDDMIGFRIMIKDLSTADGNLTTAEQQAALAVLAIAVACLSPVVVIGWVCAATIAAGVVAEANLVNAISAYNDAQRETRISFYTGGLAWINR